MKVGIQLYSVKNTLAKDPFGTLEKVAKMGYRYWETAQVPALAMANNYGLGLEVADAKKFLADNDVKIIGAHVWPLDLDAYQGFLDYHAEIGNDKVGLSASFFDDMDDLKAKCELYNKAGEMAKKQGMLFYYHNHFHEFQKYEDKYVMDWIAELTDPELVGLQLDTYWAARGGVDPVEMIDRYKDRLVNLHQKDFPKDAGEPINLFEERLDPNVKMNNDVYHFARRPTSFSEVGTGIMDIQAIINAGNRIGVPIFCWSRISPLWTSGFDQGGVLGAFQSHDGIEWV